MNQVPEIWPWLKEFATINWPFILLVYGALRGIAKVSPWTWDEKLLDGIRAAVGMSLNSKK